MKNAVKRILHVIRFVPCPMCGIEYLRLRLLSFGDTRYSLRQHMKLTHRIDATLLFSKLTIEDE